LLPLLGVAAPHRQYRRAEPGGGRARLRASPRADPFHHLRTALPQSRRAMSTRIDIVRLREMKRTGEKIVSLTAYDASFARLLAECGVEIVLVGDSLGTVLHGARNTLGVTLDDVVYHTRITSRAAGGALVLADMPFMSYATPEQAFASAARLV